MASSLPAASATAAAASVTKPTSSSSSSLPFPARHCLHPNPKASFPPSPKLKLQLCFKALHSNRNHSTPLKAQLNEVAVDGSSNAVATPENKSKIPPVEKDDNPGNELSPSALATETSISEFITQVSSLIKLVDSRDVVELQLKQLDCELIIRKKEALPPPPSPPVVMMQSPYSPAAMPSAFPPAPPVAPPTPSAPGSSTSTPAPSPSASKSAKSSLPSLKSPMAGTFYRSPAPGEPPFVKVGDKVTKGQILCIIEAMKLMNEIEADQSGTIVEILVDDGKPISVDTPLFVIEP
ncbi:PREDICTED: biotin carboxyl carrier protein of acetyl-CoA carboxylase, chloroplastic [Nelumbo nucifera]|uniref:Biotin carboxyl carrier protein of acetyl-CoA carboxylase n=1 Tax=Nelumbo nucifera TaxID=4432 RepID=A0A1U7Z568_NELNU|nr:PREDICTED: biotin carboxyl carrier protein of acetyl-CoA carboxylase, chloroplastic [Nelumbo nucifera]